MKKLIKKFLQLFRYKKGTQQPHTKAESIYQTIRNRHLTLTLWELPFGTISNWMLEEYIESNILKALSAGRPWSKLHLPAEVFPDGVLCYECLYIEGELISRVALIQQDVIVEGKRTSVLQTPSLILPKY